MIGYIAVAFMAAIVGGLGGVFLADLRPADPRTVADLQRLLPQAHIEEMPRDDGALPHELVIYTGLATPHGSDTLITYVGGD